MLIPTTLHNPVRSDYTAIQTKLSTAIKKGMKKHKIVGMSLALIDDGEVVWAEGFGYADRENKRLADKNTLYKVGSITKVFTAIAAMQLVEKKQLNLDAPVQTYIPELDIKYHTPTNNPITLRHLMNHTSGLQVDQMAGMFNKNPEHFSNVIDFLNKNHAAYAPGTIATYSNLAMDLVGVIIERVFGQSFEAYMTDNLLTPLGMSQSVLREKNTNPLLMSLGYKKGKFHEEYPIRSVPAGNLHSNVVEMSQFIGSILQEGAPLISRHSFKEMTRIQTDDTKFDSGAKFGLNWFLQNPQLDYAGKFLSHNGGTMNFISSLMILPEKKLGVIVLSNSAMQIQFIDETATQTLQQALKVKHGLSPPPKKTWPEIISPPDEAVSILCGNYVTPLGFAKIDQDKKGLFANLLHKKIRLKYHKDGWLSLKFKLFGLIPIPLPGLNKIRIQTRKIAGEKILYAEEHDAVYITGKIFSANAISPIWRSRLGEYKVDYRDGDYHWAKKIVLTERDGILFFNIKDQQIGGSLLIINPLNECMAIFEGIGRAMQETIYAKGEYEKSEIFYSGYRLIFSKRI